MKKWFALGALFVTLLAVAGCATAPKKTARPVVEAPAAQNPEVLSLKSALDEQKVLAAEAEARAAKAENDLRELEMARSKAAKEAAAKDPYLK